MLRLLGDFVASQVVFLDLGNAVQSDIIDGDDHAGGDLQGFRQQVFAHRLSVADASVVIALVREQGMVGL